MGLPRPAEARLYYRAAKHRYEDAELLLEAGRTTGAVYLAGYTVECFLKALLLASVAPGLQKQLLGTFRGSRAHDIEWLGALYREHVETGVPTDVTRHLSRVASWSPDLRYAARALKRREADEFMESVVAIVTWADERM
jgi:HEPN domain-containing protein